MYNVTFCQSLLQAHEHNLFHPRTRSLPQFFNFDEQFQYSYIPPSMAADSMLIYGFLINKYRIFVLRIVALGPAIAKTDAYTTIFSSYKRQKRARLAVKELLARTRLVHEFLLLIKAKEVAQQCSLLLLACCELAQ